MEWVSTGNRYSPRPLAGATHTLLHQSSPSGARRQGPAAAVRHPKFQVPIGVFSHFLGFWAIPQGVFNLLMFDTAKRREDAPKICHSTADCFEKGPSKKSRIPLFHLPLTLTFVIALFSSSSFPLRRNFTTSVPHSVFMDNIKICMFATFQTKDQLTPRRTFLDASQSKVS